MILLGNNKINLTSLGMVRRAKLSKLCLKHSTHINDHHTWGRLKLKLQGQAIPWQSIYMEWKLPGSYSRVYPSLPTADCTYQSYFASVMSPSLSHFRTVLHAALISYSALAWHPQGLRANVPSHHSAQNSYSYNPGERSRQHHSSSQVMDK